jgi:drug/metabolite transporter (DMT)-like permease
MNSKTIKLIGLLIVLVFTEFWALYFIQKSQKEKRIMYLFITMFLYGIPISYLLYKLMDFKSIAIVNFLWNIFSTCSGFFITCFIYKEKVNHLEWIGVMLGLVSIGLIIFGGQKKQLSDSSKSQK